MDWLQTIFAALKGSHSAQTGNIAHFKRNGIASSKKSTHRSRLSFFEKLEPRQMLDAMPLISEFMASNNNTLLDGDGNSPDWIEIHNAGDQAINLQGWSLTDDSGELQKWSFPDKVLGVDEYLVVFASGQDVDNYVDAGGYLHTNFKLSSDGEYLALVQSD